MVPHDADEEQPDALFALVCGLYLAAIAGTLAMIAARGAIADVGLLYGLLLAVLATVTGFGTLAVRRVAGLAGILGRTRLAWWLAAGPAVVGTGLFGLRAAGLAPIGMPAVVLAAFGGLAAGALGFVLVSMATTRWVAAETADATVHATWQAPWPRRDRRLAVGVGIALVAAGVVGLAAGVALERPAVRTIGQGAIPFGAVVATFGRQRTYRATDRGLEIRHPVARRLVAWSTIREYRVADDAIVLRGRWPWSPGWRIDPAALEDVLGVLSALDRYVDRR